MEVSKWQQADSNTLGTVVTGRLCLQNRKKTCRPNV